MVRTKLGISNCLEAGVFYLLMTVSIFYSSAVFALPALVLGGFILYKEDDIWLKASAVKGILLAAFVGLISVCFGFTDNFLEFINFFLRIAKEMPISDGYQITGWFMNMVFVLEKILFILLTFMAFAGKTVKIPVIDGIIMKHIR